MYLHTIGVLPLPEDSPALSSIDGSTLLFSRMKDHILAIAEELYGKYDEVLTYRGVDYATSLMSAKPLTAVEHQVPVLRGLAHLLRERQ